jgi:hypothetical protein
MARKSSKSAAESYLLEKVDDAAECYTLTDDEVVAILDRIREKYANQAAAQKEGKHGRT